MSKLYLEYLRHILTEINFIVEQSHGLEQGEFSSDEVMKRAIVRSIEIICEAVKRLPVELREQHSEIDWKGIAGTREKLIHISSWPMCRADHPRRREGPGEAAIPSGMPNPLILSRVMAFEGVY